MMNTTPASIVSNIAKNVIGSVMMNPTIPATSPLKRYLMIEFLTFIQSP